MDYVYWNPGDKRPAKRPIGCEVSDQNGNWIGSTWKPSEWEYSPRRWPKVKKVRKAGPDYKKLLEAMLRGTSVATGDILINNSCSRYHTYLTKVEEDALVKIRKGMK